MSYERTITRAKLLEACNMLLDRPSWRIGLNIDERDRVQTTFELMTEFMLGRYAASQEDDGEWVEANRPPLPLPDGVCFCPLEVAGLGDLLSATFAREVDDVLFTYFDVPRTEFVSGEGQVPYSVTPAVHVTVTR